MKQYLTCTLIVVIFSAFTASVSSQTTYTFSTAGNWNVAANWTGGVVPPDPLPSGDFIVINANCTRSWFTTVNGTMTVNAGKTLTINSSLETIYFNNAGIVNNYGTIDCQNDDSFVNLSGNTITNFSGASFKISQIESLFSNYGTFINNSGATVTTITVTSGVANQTGGVFTNNGTVDHVGIFQNYPGSTLNNNGTFNGTTAAGAIVNQSGATINLNSGSTLTSFCTFDNLGTLNLVAGGNLALTHNPVVWPAGTFNWSSGSTVTVGGTLAIASGETITIPNGCTLTRINGNAISVNSGGSLINNGIFTPGVGAFTVNSGGVLANNATGTMTIASCILDNSGTTTNQGILNINQPVGQVANNSGGNFDNSGTIHNNYLFKNSGAFSNGGTFNLNANPATLELNTNPAGLPAGTFNWNSGGHVKIGANGVMTLNSTLTVAAGRNLDMDPGGQLIIAGSGQLVINGNAYIYGQLVNNGILTNSSTGVTQISGAGSLTNNATLNNAGTLDLTAPFTTTGTFNLTNGLITYGYANAAFPGGTFNWSGGVLRLTGTMTLTSPVTIPAGRDFKILGGVLNNSTTLTNNGIFSSNTSGTVNNNSVFANYGTFPNLLTLNNNGTLNNYGSITVTTVFTNSSGNTTTNFSGATFTTLGAGNLNNFGTFTNNSGGTVSTYSTVNNQNGGIFTSGGTLTHGGNWQNYAGSILNINSLFTGDASATILNNQAGATINLSNSSTLRLYCNFTNSGTLNLNTGCNLGLYKSPVVFPGGTFNWAGTVTIGVNMTIASGETITVPAGATLTNAVGATLTVNSGGVLINNATGTIILTTTMLNSGTVTNNGVFTINGGGMYNYSGATCTNNGTINSNVIFSNSGSLTNIGTFNLSAGTLELNNNPAVLPAGTFNWNSGATVRIGATGVMTLSNTLTVAAGRNFYVYPGGMLTVTNSGQLINNGNVYIYSPITNNGTITTNLSLIVDLGGTLTNNGILTNTRNLYVYSGSLINNGTLNSSGIWLHFYDTFSNNGTLNLSGGNMVFEYANALRPAGIFNWTAGSFRIFPPVTMTLNSPLTIPAAGVFIVESGALLTNATTLTAVGVLYVSGTMNNNSLLINNGNIVPLSGGTFNNNGTLKGSGSNQGVQQFTNPIGGIFAPGNSPGCYNLNQGFTNLGMLQIEINGPNACSQFDRVVVTGTTTKGGTLDLIFGFTPTLGQTFQIITSTSFSGNFGTITVSPNTIQVTEAGGIVTISSVLPIELTDFSAIKQDQTVRLDWTTATETNNKGFFIERSADGERWQTLGFVAGQGNSTTSVSYSFLDEKPLPGINYYRLLQVDFDGRETFSAVVPVTLEDRPGKLAIYPNPVAAGSEVLITYPFSDDEAMASLRILDATGRQVAVSNDAKRLSTTDLQPGVYWLEIRSDLGYSIGKLVVQ